eukprot:gene22484-biopygen14783
MRSTLQVKARKKVPQVPLLEAVNNDGDRPIMPYLLCACDNVLHRSVGRSVGQHVSCSDLLLYSNKSNEKKTSAWLRRAKKFFNSDVLAAPPDLKGLVLCYKACSFPVGTWQPAFATAFLLTSSLPRQHDAVPTNTRNSNCQRRLLRAEPSDRSVPRNQALQVSAKYGEGANFETR